MKENCFAFETIEEMETNIDESMPHAMFILNLGNDQSLAKRCIQSLKSRFPTCRIALLSSEYGHGQLRSAIGAGATGFFLTSWNCTTLIKSIEVVLNGQAVIPEQAMKLVRDYKTVAPTHAPASHVSTRVPSSSLSADPFFTDREIIVLRCLRNAMSNKLIAHECNVSEANVKVHVKAILRKIRGKNRTEAAIWARNQGFEPYRASSHGSEREVSAATDAAIQHHSNQPRIGE